MSDKTMWLTRKVIWCVLGLAVFAICTILAQGCGPDRDYCNVCDPEGYNRNPCLCRVWGEDRTREISQGQEPTWDMCEGPHNTGADSRCPEEK